jgi:hypothetical protein
MNKVLQLKKKFTQLAILDATFQVFGSESHQYQLNPCLRDADIQAFEEKHQITLPSEYRQFLLEVGNGGAGPGYGLYSIPGLASAKEITATSHPLNLEILAQPFLLTEAWNDLDLIIKNPAGMVVNNQAYLDKKFIQGTLTMANYGCGMYALLVITGEQQGKIWIDDRTNESGIYPASGNFCHYFHDADHEEFQPDSDDEQPLSFYDWYEDWLNRSLYQIRQPV